MEESQADRFINRIVIVSFLVVVIGTFGPRLVHLITNQKTNEQTLSMELRVRGIVPDKRMFYILNTEFNRIDIFWKPQFEPKKGG